MPAGDLRQPGGEIGNVGGSRRPVRGRLGCFVGHRERSGIMS